MSLKTLLCCSPGLALLLLAACGGSPEPEAEGRDQLLSRTWEYNVVVVLLDAARSDHFGHLGYDRPTTPNIDSLATRSVVFEQAYAQASGTATSVYSFLSSRYPVFEKVPRLVGQNAILLDQEATTLMEAMASRHPHRLVLSTNPFVREYLGLTQGATKVIEDWRFDPHLKPDEPPRFAERVTAPAFDWMREHAEDGFFAYLHYLEPHQPYLPPEPWLSRLARATAQPRLGQTETLSQLGKREPHPRIKNAVIDLYDGNLAYVDSHVGALVDSLRAGGLLERTIIVLISDHGEAFWEHGGHGHGGEPYEELVRVPFLIPVPGVPELEGRRIAEPVELVDLMPTLLEMMGIPVDELDLVGQSLVNIMLTGKGDPQRLVHARSNRTERPAYALREGRWKWLLHLEDGRQELYDLDEDPGEKFDLVAAGKADASRLENFSAKLGEWLEYGRIDEERAAPVDNRMLDESMIETLRSLGYIE